MQTEPLKLLVQKLARHKILVIGDLMIDEYVWGKVERISPEAPVQVVEVDREAFTLGGAGNVAHNLVALGAQVYVGGLIGRDSHGAWLRDEFARLGVDCQALVEDRERPTIRKTRVVAVNQQVLRLDREVRAPLSAAQ